jgi:hypothetical protein
MWFLFLLHLGDISWEKVRLLLGNMQEKLCIYAAGVVEDTLIMCAKSGVRRVAMEKARL